MADESKVSDDLVLVSQEGEKFSVSRKVGQMSELVKVLTEDADSSDEVPLMDVKTPVLAKVIEFCKHHVENKLPEIEKVSCSLTSVLFDDGNAYFWNIRSP